MDELITCQECGTQYETYEKVCPYCGRTNK